MTNDEILALRTMPSDGDWTAPGCGPPTQLTRGLVAEGYIEIELMRLSPESVDAEGWRARLTPRGKKVVVAQ